MRASFGCGKVILFGEHAVVHGQPALAAGLSLGIWVREDRPSDALGFDVATWGTSTQEGNDDRMAQALGRVAQVVRQRCGALPNVHMVLEADVPVGAGLGSSAAMAVALARHLVSLAQSPAPNPTEVILEAADAAERIFHGNPSGVDHTTSTLGGVLNYRKDRPERFVSLDVQPVPLLIAQMEPGADTGRMVAGVTALLQAEPEAMGLTMDLLGTLTRQAQRALEDDDLERLGRLMNIAHGGLMSIGVSTPTLDKGTAAARRAGAWGAKLTGAGGGGCMIAVGPTDKHQAIAQALRDAGALKVLSTTAGHRPN